jgi:hypothetical protein
VIRSSLPDFSLNTLRMNLFRRGEQRALNQFSEGVIAILHSAGGAKFTPSAPRQDSALAAVAEVTTAAAQDPDPTLAAASVSPAWPRGAC